MKKTILQTLDADPNNIELIPGAGIQDFVFAKIESQLRQLYQQPQTIDRLLLETLTQSFIMHALNNYTTHRLQQADQQVRLGRNLLNRITAYISDNLSEPIGLDELAALAGISPYHFARSFKKATGLSPHQYIIHCRMQKAKQLLLKSKLSITDIALDVGYKDVSNFINAFRKAVGTSPKKYRSP